MDKGGSRREAPSDEPGPADVLAEILAMRAPLRDRLAAYVDVMVAEGSPFVAAYDRLVDHLAKAEVGAGAPAPGEAMPPFVLPDQSGRLVGLEDIVGSGPAILSFNRGPWCPFCRIELATHLEALPTLARHEARLVSIMPEPRSSTAPLARALGERLVVLSDIDNGYALSIGLAMWVGDEVIALMREHGLDLGAFQGNEGWMLPLPATFVLDREARVLARWVDPDFRTRMETEAILSVLAGSER